MPLSQKTVGKLDVLLRRLLHKPPRALRTLPLWTWRAFRDALYQEGFDVHFLDHIEQRYYEDPSRFLPHIHNGMISAFLNRNDGYGAPAPNDEDQAMGQAWLAGMIQVVVPKAESIPDHVGAPTPRRLSAELLLSLREDGFDLIGGKIVPAEMQAVDLQREDSYLIALIRSIGPANMEEIQHHHDESDRAFAHEGWGSASSEARNFLIAMLRGLREVATARGKVPAYKQPGKDGPLIEDFKAIGLFTDEEKNAVMHVWVLLSHSGPHVGIKEEDSARLSRLLAIGMAEWIVLKFITWENQGFRPF